MRTIDWVDGAIELIDQTLLPDKCVTLRVHTVDDLVDAIRRLAVRGAPALGVAGALGVVLADGDQELIARLRAARPTAVRWTTSTSRPIRSRFTSAGTSSASRSAASVPGRSE